MTNVLKQFQSKYNPLQQLLFLGLIIRLVSVIFSKGFGWHDDHFLIVEVAQSWVDGYDNKWLPSASEPDRQPQGHSLFYVGIHYFIFKLLSILGFVDPQSKMIVVRLLHALWSLLIIKYGYKIAEQYASQKVAWYCGLFLALFWFMPFVSVRNLAEFVCIPPVLIAIYHLNRPELNWKIFLYAGLLLGISFSIRFQTVFLTGGIGLALLIKKTSFKNILLLSLGFIAIFLLTQGLVDFLIWKRPFAEFLSYVQYNLDNASAYGADVWHMYLDLILGLLIPPLSIVLFAGYFYSWKKTALIFWPVFFYLAFHSYFPNKQERFIMTVLPLIVISGTIGMYMLHEKYQAKINLRLFKFSKAFVIVLNCILLLVLSVSYSKRHRVEAVYYLYKKADSRNFFVEDSNKDDSFLMPPMFYYGRFASIQGISKKEYTWDDALHYYNSCADSVKPKYVIFWQAENIEARVDSLKMRFPTLTYETTIEPSLIDKTLYFLNPLNDNHSAFIYKL